MRPTNTVVFERAGAMALPWEGPVENRRLHRPKVKNYTTVFILNADVFIRCICKPFHYTVIAMADYNKENQKATLTLAIY